MARMVEELNSVSCLSLEEVSAKKSLVLSRSFWRKVTALSDVKQALSLYAEQACEKLRVQHSVTQ
jgi:DNA polymerase V